MHISIVFLLLSIIAGFSVSFAADYHVGPGQTYANIGDVAWESLVAGDTVFIHARPAPYAEKWVINRIGTANAPITVRGVPDASGALPIIHGEGATTRSQLNYWNENRGILKIGGSNIPADGTPSHIIVENLHFRRARGAFTGRNGASTYAANAAGIYVEKGNQITIRNCVLEDNGNGLFVASATTIMVLEGNHFFGNGNAGSIYEHNTYTAARGILYQYNRFGPLCTGCGGNNLKDRSSGTVIRYNWIEGGNRQLDLVDGEDDPAIVADPAYLQTFVYANILIEPDGAGNSQIVHFGGDSGNVDIYRGALYFWNNTVISTRSGNTTLLRLSTNNQTADVRNNIVYVTASGNRLALVDSAGILHYGWNFFKPGFVASHSGVTGTVSSLGGNVLGENPRFVSEALQDFHLAADSPARNAAGPFAGPVSGYPLDSEYRKHQMSLPRPTDALLDMGAFEFSPVQPDAYAEVTCPVSVPAGLPLYVAARIHNRTCGVPLTFTKVNATLVGNADGTLGGISISGPRGSAINLTVPAAVCPAEGVSNQFTVPVTMAVNTALSGKAARVMVEAVTADGTIVVSGECIVPVQ